MLRVARVCAETAQSPWVDALPPDSDFVDKRAAWRVGFLRIARWSASLTWLILGVTVWTKYKLNIRVYGLPGWFPVAPARCAMLAAFIAFAMWATSRVLRSIWYRWVYIEQEAVLTHQKIREDRIPFTLVWMAIVVWTLILATYFIDNITIYNTTDFYNRPLKVLKASINPDHILAFLWGILALAGGSAVSLVYLRPPPEPPRLSDGRADLIGREARTAWYRNKSLVIIGFIFLTATIMTVIAGTMIVFPEKLREFNDSNTLLSRHPNKIARAKFIPISRPATIHFSLTLCPRNVYKKLSTVALASRFAVCVRRSDIVFRCEIAGLDFLQDFVQPCLLPA